MMMTVMMMMMTMMTQNFCHSPIVIPNANSSALTAIQLATGVGWCSVLHQQVGVGGSRLETEIANAEWFPALFIQTCFILSSQQKSRGFVELCSIARIDQQAKDVWWFLGWLTDTFLPAILHFDSAKVRRLYSTQTPLVSLFLFQIEISDTD